MAAWMRPPCAQAACSIDRGRRHAIAMDLQFDILARHRCVGRVHGGRARAIDLRNIRPRRLPLTLGRLRRPSRCLVAWIGRGSIGCSDRVTSTLSGRSSHQHVEETDPPVFPDGQRSSDRACAQSFQNDGKARDRSASARCQTARRRQQPDFIVSRTTVVGGSLTACRWLTCPSARFKRWTIAP
jgi:hypothetical protein